MKTKAYRRMLAALACLATAAAGAAAEKPPIILFILADDMGWNQVGYHGSAYGPGPEALAGTENPRAFFP